MKLKLMVIALLFGVNLLSKGQDLKIKLIKNFYKDLYNREVKAIDVVHKYIKYSDSSDFKNAVESVSSLRNIPVSKDEYFVSLRQEILADKFSISGYDSFSHEEKSKFKLLKSPRRIDIYKLSFANLIPTYILLSGNKIESFFGYQKAGDGDYTFIVYH